MVDKSLSSFFGPGFPSAVIWDMDGVLSLTMNLHNEALRITCQAHGLKIPNEIYQLGVGRADDENIKYILKHNLIFPEEINYNEFFVALQEQKNNFLLDLIAEREFPSTPNVCNWLNALSSRSIPCAVSSSSTIKVIIKILEKLNLSGFFQAVISGAELPQSKPHPAIFLKTAQVLNILPENCLVIEDSPHGVEAAKNAGMRCIAIGTTMPISKLKNADIVINDLSEYPVELALKD